MKEKALKKLDFFLIFLHHPVLEHTLSVLEFPFPVLEHPFPGFWGVILSRDVPWKH